MTDSSSTFVGDFMVTAIRTAAEYPLPALLVIVAVQVGMISAAARFLAGTTAARQPVAAHRIYLAAIVLVLALAPAHYFLGGWEVSTVAENEPPPAVLPSETQSVGSQPPSPTGHLDDVTDFEPAVTARVREHAAPTFQWQSETSPNDSPESFGSVALSAVPRPAESNSSTRDLASAAPANRIAGAVLVSLYAAGFCLVVIRFVIGTRRLASKARRGRRLVDRTQGLAESIAAEVGLPAVPAVRMVDGVAMPLVFGAIRPAVLLPADFESWTRDEQRATLLHELTHVRRRDTAGQLLATVMKAVYWCHPSIWFLNRRLTEAREWATDEQAIRSGMDARKYAENLVNVIARIRTGNTFIHSAAIGMAAGHRLDDRLRQILSNASRRHERRKVAVVGSIATMLLIATVTTVRVVVAADPQPPATPVTSPAAAPEEAPQAKQAAAKTNEASLVSRLADCDVLNVTGDEFEAIFHASGRVLSPSGQPVAGAVVVLRESSMSRISSEPDKFIYAPNRHQIRTRDVFARTETDADGRFTFEAVKSPAFPEFWSNSWRGDVFAAHPDFGVGNLPLTDKQERQRYDQDLEVNLLPTTTVTGRYLSPAGTPIRGATVRATRCALPNTSSSYSDRGMDLYMSQLSPQALTDVKGEFVLRGVPVGFIGSITLSHPDWLDGYAEFATSDDVPTGPLKMRGRDRDVQGLPVEVVADAGILFTGRVIDPDGQPVDGARVSFGSTTTRTESDKDGNYRLKLSSKMLDRYRQPDTDAPIYVWLDGSNGLLGRTLEVPVSDLESGAPLNIELQRGVRVTGRVVTEQGDPVADVLVYSIATKQGGSSTADGTFDILLSKAEHTLVFGTDKPGFTLPKRRDLYRFDSDDDLERVLHRKIDLTAGADTQVPPITVSSQQSIRVVVLLPGGQPAVGATVIIKDLQPSPAPASTSGYVRPPRVIERSESVVTGPAGAVELSPLGVATPDAYVEVKLTTEESSYDGEALISAAQDGVVTVKLQRGWIVEGRVLLNDAPFPGVRVAVGESTPNIRTVNGRTFRGSRVSNFREETTDPDGWYRVPVRAGKDYSVSIRELPGMPDSRVGLGYRPGQETEGRLLTKPFAFTSGDQQIAGLVLDENGDPVVGANVSVMRSSRSQPDFWLGHRSESQLTTDAAGKFHLKKVPAGSHVLRVSGPRNGAQRTPTTSVDAQTGETDLKITLVNQAAPDELPRLQPRRIETIKPSSGEKP